MLNPFIGQQLVAESPFRLDIDNEATLPGYQLGGDPSLPASEGDKPALGRSDSGYRTEEDRGRRQRRYSLVQLGVLQTIPPAQWEQSRQQQARLISVGALQTVNPPSTQYGLAIAHPNRQDGLSSSSGWFSTRIPRPELARPERANPPQPILVRHIRTPSGAIRRVEYLNSLSQSELRSRHASGVFSSDPSLYAVSRTTTPPGSPPPKWQARSDSNPLIHDTSFGTVPPPLAPPIRKSSALEMPPPPFIPSVPSQHRFIPAHRLPPPPAYAPVPPPTAPPELRPQEDAAIRILAGLSISRSSHTPSAATLQHPSTPSYSESGKQGLSISSRRSSGTELEKKAGKVVVKKRSVVDKKVTEDVEAAFRVLKEENFQLRVNLAAMEVAKQESDRKLIDARNHHEGRVREINKLNENYNELQEKYDELERERDQLRVDIEALHRDAETPRIKRGRSSISVSRAEPRSRKRRRMKVRVMERVE